MEERVVMHTERHSLLLVSAMEGAENLARYLSREMEIEVAVARTCRAAAATLRREEFSIVLCDTALICREDLGVLHQRIGYAVPLEADIARLGAEKLLRRLKNVLERREQEVLLARLAATHEIGDTLRHQVTGLLLQSDLILREKSLSPALANKLEQLREMADGIRVRLQNA